MATTTHTEALGELLVQVGVELRRMIERASATPAFPMCTGNLQLPGQSRIYARVYTNGVGAVRFAQTEAELRSMVRFTTVVVANIEIDPELRGQGFLKLLEELVFGLEGVEVLEYENVLSERLKKCLMSRGYKPVNSSEGVTPSLFLFKE